MTQKASEFPAEKPALVAVLALPRKAIGAHQMNPFAATRGEALRKPLSKNSHSAQKCADTQSKNLSQDLTSSVGFEPTTNGLKVRRSTN